MKISIIIHLSFLLLASLVKTSREDDESCVSTNVTYALCVINDTNLTIVSESFTAELLVDECHEHFIEEVIGKPICEEHTTEEEEGKHPSAAQRYGYGFLAVFIISILSLGGLFAFPLIRKASLQYILATFTALAVGTLFGDTMFHLIPFALGLHTHAAEEHEAEGHGHEHRHGEEEHSSMIVPVYQWRMFTSVMVLYGFYLLEVFLHWVIHFRQNKNSIHSHGHSHAFQNGNEPKTDQVNNNSTITIDGNLAHDHHSHNHMHYHNCNELDLTVEPIDRNLPDHINMQQISVSNEKVSSIDNEKTLADPPQAIRITGWMIILGDSIHNFADGLAIGAAFSEDLMLGLTTTIAIGCHELPHEFGDYAVLIQSGFTHVRALVWNFISATTAFIGFFVGAAVSTNESARQWIFTITIGMFLYIALVDLLPTLLPEKRIELKRFILVNIGFLVGITIMFVLAIFEDKLVDSGR